MNGPTRNHSRRLSQANRRIPRRAGFTLMELLVVVAIIVILSSAMFVVGRGVINSSHRQRTIATLKNLDAIMSEWQEKMGSLRVFSDTAGWLCPANNYKALVAWNSVWTDMTPWSVAQYSANNADPNNPKLNAVRWVYALYLQSNCKNMLANINMKGDATTPGSIPNNFLYANAVLPANISAMTFSQAYLYPADSYGNPIVLFQTRLPDNNNAVTGAYQERDTPNVRGHGNKLYVFVSAGPDGLFNTMDDIYSDSE